MASLLLKVLAIVLVNAVASGSEETATSSWALNPHSVSSDFDSNSVILCLDTVCATSTIEDTLDAFLAEFPCVELKSDSYIFEHGYEQHNPKKSVSFNTDKYSDSHSGNNKIFLRKKDGYSNLDCLNEGSIDTDLLCIIDVIYTPIMRLDAGTCVAQDLTLSSDYSWSLDWFDGLATWEDDQYLHFDQGTDDLGVDLFILGLFLSFCHYFITFYFVFSVGFLYNCSVFSSVSRRFVPVSRHFRSFTPSVHYFPNENESYLSRF